MNFDGTFLFGNCIYNKETSFYLSEKVGVQFVHTTKHGPALYLVYGKVNYQTTIEQQKNRVWWLLWGQQQQLGSLIHSFSYIGMVLVVWHFCNVPTLHWATPRLSKLQHIVTLSMPPPIQTLFLNNHQLLRMHLTIQQSTSLTKNDVIFHVILKEHTHQSMTKGQSGIKWHYSNSFHIPSMALYHILPKNQESLSDVEAGLLHDNIGNMLLFIAMFLLLISSTLGWTFQLVQNWKGLFAGHCEELFTSLCKQKHTKTDWADQTGPVATDYIDRRGEKPQNTLLVPLVDKYQ